MSVVLFFYIDLESEINCNHHYGYTCTDTVRQGVPYQL